MATYSYTGAAQIFTVKSAGTYTITAYGGAGGGASGKVGGAGAEVGGTFMLQAGEKLEIIAGGVGRYGIDAGGGGGGSFVLGNTGSGYTLLLAAGGGGGAANGRATGGAGTANPGTGADGVVGAGGAASDRGGGGGSGYKGDGGTSNGGHGGYNRTGGYAGGANLGGDTGRGGFGGGGGGTDDTSNDGGGGGGYSGGVGGNGAGGGGGSIDKGTAIAAQTRSGVNTKAGKVSIICFAAGTRIRVMRETGPTDVAVEDLTVGDVAINVAGDLRAIRWLASRAIDCCAHHAPRKVWPIRIAAGAFGRNRPARDLYVSPEHSLCIDLVDEVLIPAAKLINGSTVAQVKRDSVTYWHVELDSHDILLAENMPAESYLEMGANRALLGLADDAWAGDVSPEVLARTHADFCRLFVDAGPLLDTVRAQLAVRAERLGWQPSREAAIACRADGVPLPAEIADGSLFAAVPAGATVEIACDTLVPANFGEADGRRLGLAIYAITVSGADGATRSLDLDGPSLAESFHKGERIGRLHYRWTQGVLTVPASLTAELPGPLLLRLTYEPSTIRGWIAPEPAQERTQVRLLAS